MCVDVMCVQTSCHGARGLEVKTSRQRPVVMSSDRSLLGCPGQVPSLTPHLVRPDHLHTTQDKTSVLLVARTNFDWNEHGCSVTSHPCIVRHM